MTIFPRLIISSIILVTLIGCGATNPTSNPTTTPSQLSPSVTATKDAQRLPTATRRPSATPSPSPTIDLTETVIYQDMLTAQSIEQTLVAQFPHVCENLYAPREFSPNGLWLTELCTSNQGLILTLSKKDSQVLWKLVYDDYIPQTDFEPGGALSVVHWSQDERYAYFFSYLGGDGGECFYRGEERGAGLFRLDLQSGYTTAILPQNNDSRWYGFSFSPTDRRLVYGIRTKDLKILDITTGEIIGITSGDNNYETGGYLWSLDGMKLIYSVLTYNEQGERGNYSLRLVNIQTGIEQILFEAPDKCYSALTWATNGMLIVERQGSDGPVIIEYDLNSNNIINESTATPFP
jgi:WD40 repeat protein